MASLNRVQLIGRLGKDPEVKTTPSGAKVCNFSLAVSHRWRASDGAPLQETDWFQVESWGRLAEVCQQYAHKGQLVYLEGRLKTDRYESQGETRYFTKVVTSNIQLLEYRGEEADNETVDEVVEI